MVPERYIKLGWEVSLRVISVTSAFLLTLFFYSLFSWLIGIFGYHPTINSYVSSNFFAEPEIILGLVFWGSIFFSFLGTRFDYVSVTLFFAYGVSTYLATPNSFYMIVGLIAAFSIGNTLGYFLGFLRKVKRTDSYPDDNSLKYKLMTRGALLVCTFVVATWTSGFFTEIVTGTLNYQEPPAFFGFLQGLSTELLGISLSWLFWGSVALGGLGKRVDYILSGLLFVFTIWWFSLSENDTRLMYQGVFSIALLGNVVGYLLKLARVRWFAR